jgi:hypothetical protein
MDPSRIDTEAFVGKGVRVKIDIDEKLDPPRNKIAEYRRPKADLQKRVDAFIEKLWDLDLRPDERNNVHHMPNAKADIPEDLHDAIEDVPF